MGTVREGETLALAEHTPWVGSAEPIRFDPNDPGAALRTAGLNWGVDRRPVYVKATMGGYREVPDRFATVRTDTERPLGIVGRVHTLIQNEAQLDFLTALSLEGAEIQAAGMVDYGRIVYWLARLGDLTIADEAYSRFVFLRNYHDGGGSFQASAREMRLACANVVQGWARSGIHFGRQAASTWKIRHTQASGATIGEAREALGIADEHAELTKKAGEELVLRPWTPRDNEAMLEHLFPTAEDLPARTNALNARRAGECREIMADEPNLEPIRGTAWGAFNAVCQWADHQFPFRETRRASEAESRLLGILDEGGSSFTIKRRALGYLDELG